MNAFSIGKNKPSPELLKKVVGVRRHVVYNALNFLIQNNPEWADVTLDNNVDLPVDGVPDVIMQTLTHEEETEDDANEHSTYTPQTDLDNIPADSVIMDSVGMVDLEGSTVNSTDQIASAILELQGKSKRKSKFTVKTARTRMEKIRSTPEGRKNNRKLTEKVRKKYVLLMKDEKAPRN